MSASKRWWLLPDAFKGFGHNGSFFANETHYLGGWPEHAKTYTGKLTKILVIDRNGVALRGFSVIFTIPWNQITDLDVDGAENASKRLTASRALLLGPLALVAKKKTKNSMLIVTTTSGHQALFHSEQYTASEMRMKLLPIITQIRLAVVDQQPAGPPGMATAPSRAVSVADELTKLMQLRTSGVLTEQEFAAQKAKLLRS